MSPRGGPDLAHARERPGLEAFSPPAAGSVVKVIGLIPGQLLTEKRLLPAPVRNGRLATAPAQDILKLAVVERHHGTGHLGLGLVQGFGLPQGALASSVAHDSHNIVVVGADEADMLQAVRHLVDLGGGMAVVAGGRVLADLPLPIAGLISPWPLDRVAAAYSRLKAGLPGPGRHLTRSLYGPVFSGPAGHPGLETHRPGAGGRGPLPGGAAVGGGLAVKRQSM